jgi:hypothetical protein
MRRKPAAPDPIDKYRYTGELRTVDGQLPRGCPRNWHWSISQGEPLYPFGEWGHGSRDLSFWTDYTITLIPLNNGKWIVRPIKSDVLFSVTSPQFDDRATALRTAVAEVLRRVRRNARPQRWVNPYQVLRPALAQELVEWALSLVDRPAPRLLVKPPPKPPAPARPPQGELFGEWS